MATFGGASAPAQTSTQGPSDLLPQAFSTAVSALSPTGTLLDRRYLAFRRTSRPVFIQSAFNMRKRLMGPPRQGIISVVVTDIEGYSGERWLEVVGAVVRFKGLFAPGGFLGGGIVTGIENKLGQVAFGKIGGGWDSYGWFGRCSMVGVVVALHRPPAPVPLRLCQMACLEELSGSVLSCSLS